MFSNKKFISKKEEQKFDNSLWGKYLKKFASVRYEQHDRRQQELSQEEALQREGKAKRKVDMREEYYRLQHMDLDSWEQKRVQRLPGESDNKW